MLCKDAFRPIPGLISCAGVTGRWGLLSHAQNVVKWPGGCMSTFAVAGVHVASINVPLPCIYIVHTFKDDAVLLKPFPLTVP